MSLKSLVGKAMNSIGRLSEISLLSEASYADYWGEKHKLVFTASEDVNRQLVLSNFSEQQAADFKTHWRVVDHLPNQDSGFSATLFQRIDNDPESGLKAGDYVFANRGTEPLTVDLIIVDSLGIVLRGKAGQQIADMYRYFGYLNTWMNPLFTRHRIVGNLQPSFLETAA